MTLQLCTQGRLLSMVGSSALTDMPCYHIYSASCDALNRFTLLCVTCMLFVIALLRPALIC